MGSVSPRRSRSRSRSKSGSRSGGEGSRSPIRNSKHRRSPRRRESRSPCPSSERRMQEGRVHVGNLDDAVTELDLEEKFSRFGPIIEIWLASYPPLYSFVVFKDVRDARDAVDYMNGAFVRNCKMRVSLALPRRGPGAPSNQRRRRFSPPRRPRRRSPYHRRSPRYDSSRSRSPSPRGRRASRSPSRSKSRSRSRSRSAE